MKIEIEITDEIEDTVIGASLRWHLEHLPYHEDPQYYANLKVSFEEVLEYYGEADEA